MNIMIKKMIEFQGRLYLYFLDFEKAFDRVKHDKLNLKL